MVETLVTQQEAYEYAIVDLGKIGKPFINQVNDLDVDGWHLVNVVAYTGGYVDKLGGVFRRAIAPLPAPINTTDGWYPDPAERYELRYWNGQAWTHHVSRDHTPGRDAPTALAPTHGLITYQ